MYTTIICRYHEIATKGGNRNMFEQKLLENMKYQCRALDSIVLSRVRGRAYIRRRDNLPFSDQELDVIKNGLMRCSGLENFSPALECKPEIGGILDLITKCVHAHFDPVIEKKGKIRFRTRARRSDKNFPLVSKEIEIEAATRIEEIFGEDKLIVDLDNPDVSIGIEVRDVNALVYFETIHGAGGLPAGSNSPVLALLSGGIDSPVACKMIMTRGCHVDYLTFHSFPYTPMESLDKVKGIAAVLNEHQKPGTLYACNLSEIQKAIRDACIPKFRTVLYRRMMMRIANHLCRRSRLAAIVTGESVGQVASQTVVNLGTIDAAADFVILRPLCGIDKLETIARARTLGTYELSIEDLPDSCTVFAPPSPALSARQDEILAEEEKLGDYSRLLDQAFDSMDISVPSLS